ncbi:MAG: acylphosphatase [Rhodothermales bacterium]
MSPVSTHQRLSARVFGRVQGVGFRYFTRRQARLIGLTGWVRNEYDGSVSLEAEGTQGDLEELLAAVRLGPPSAYVRDVSFHWGEATGEFSGFLVRF